MQLNGLIGLAPDLYFVKAENRGRFPFAHGLLITGSETVLIDAGMGEEVIRAIDRERRIDVLIITHSHPDHIRSWHLLEDRHLLLPRETPESAKDLQLLGERFTGSREKGAHWAWVVGEGLGAHPMRDPDGRYGDGDLLDAGGAELLAVHAPGHLDDHYCFLERRSGTLFSTDIDLTSFGPWYGNPESDIEVFRRSVRKVMSLPYERVCTSHKEPFAGGATERFEAFLKAFERQREKVFDLCREPADLDGMVDASPFYGDALRDKVIQGIFERAMIGKNLALLMRDGLVRETNGLYAQT
jgi:glyoxylase-like metal-dependent hydrolase (beta-lactamase superfamily II)